MLDDGERLVPGLPRGARAARLGRRAAAVPGRQGRRRSRTRATSAAPTRSSTIATRDGVDGLLTMSGGKLTTLRLMAQDLVDAMCDAARRRAAVPHRRGEPPGNEDGELYDIGSRLRRREATLQRRAADLRVRADRAPAARGGDAPARDDQPRRHPPQHAARHGPVPGRLLHLPRDRDPARGRPARRRAGGGVAASTSSQERWKGVWPILYGDQLRQARLDDWIFQGLLDVEHLPGGAEPDDGARSADGGRAGMSHHDVVVVGTGLAGLTAAVRLAESGARVLVLAKGVGATHLSAGTIDVLGYAPERVERPREALAGSRRAARPPVPRVGADGVARRRRRGSRTGSPAARSRRYAYTGDARREPAAADRGRRAAAVGASCRRRWPAATCATAAPVCVVGFRALKDFHPALLADDAAPRAGVEARARRARPRARGPRRRQRARLGARVRRAGVPRR